MSSLPPLIQQMQQPEFYPHPVTQPIELKQTHGSFVLLTGEFVYKVKKSVDLGFFDYSTVEKRKHFCQEELRLNQRGAPGIYLAVLPIIQHGDRFLLDSNENSDKDPVDYTLKMRQFPKDNLFVDLLDRGELTHAQMEDLGRLVADYHAEAATSEEISQFGEIAAIREAIDDNYHYTQAYIGRVQSQQQFQETKAYSDRIFTDHPDWFQARIANGKIRNCHGDLHLRNIALWGDRILLFDCIEFNQSFRYVDVMYDVAFTVMDCQARGRADLGNAFLNTYLEWTGDWQGLRVLPLYLSRQAYVRAKVTSFLLDDDSIPPQEKEAAAQTAADYYRLAWSYTQSKSGEIIMMSGLSGSGKSTTGRQIAQSQGGIQIRSDAVRKHLAGVPLNQRGPDAIYCPEMSDRTYSQLADLGVMLADLGWTVILDAKYDRRRWRDKVHERSQAANITLKIVHCQAPLAVLEARLQQRTGDIADATADLLAKQAEQAEDFTPYERSLLVDRPDSNRN
ncbi:MAG: AAA family ATPase [Sodalinema sp.]|uniref:bifunctional aminoglycoside phosphotransferase/ATP-binding protein n=1 Tax=Sodalinema sp. TaxID=3080550 RepID=UPI00396F481B